MYNKKKEMKMNEIEYTNKKFNKKYENEFNKIIESSHNMIKLLQKRRSYN